MCTAFLSLTSGDLENELSNERAQMDKELWNAVARAGLRQVQRVFQPNSQPRTPHCDSLKAAVADCGNHDHGEFSGIRWWWTHHQARF